MLGRPSMSLDDGATHDTPAISSHLPMRVASAGLVFVLLLLTVFSVTGAVTNARAAEGAQRSAAVSEQFESVYEALVAQEELADAVVTDGASERPEYDQAEAETRALLTALQGRTDVVGEVATWLGMHARYGQQVQALFVVAERVPAQAEAYETNDVDPFFDPLQRTLLDEAQQHHGEALEALESLGRSQQMLLVATPVVFGIGLVMLLAFTVVLERSRREVVAQAEDNRSRALHDALTGLPNRLLLRQQCRQAVRQAQEAGSPPLALMLLDLDRFKQVNDKLGHHAGDLVLRALAQRLRGAVRGTDMVARLGGDEFAVLLPQVADRAAALRVARKVQAAAESPITLNGVLLDVGASVGVVLSHRDADLDMLLQQADAAMYRAKASGLGVSMHDDVLDDGAALELLQVAQPMAPSPGS